MPARRELKFGELSGGHATLSRSIESGPVTPVEEGERVASQQRLTLVMRIEFCRSTWGLVVGFASTLPSAAPDTAPLERTDVSQRQRSVIWRATGFVPTRQRSGPPTGRVRRAASGAPIAEGVISPHGWFSGVAGTPRATS
jgi:hypothetical protein